ncbi:MAG: cyclopropane-fatty-acyl-phospholipid synthase family protein [Rhodobacteraceae bacterium]|nr:cyclopropane-fatty-acyl-phospholipid synthase family protein [Paracoccaceae bacterium]
MWDRLLELFLRRLVRDGTLTLTLPSGRSFRVGRGAPEYAVRLTDPSLPRRLVLSPEMGLGEGYMDGTLLIEGDDLKGFMAFLIRNARDGLPLWHGATTRLRTWLRIARQWNPAPRARRNVAHHYDLSSKLYDLFLDADRQYSCAYFARPDMSLEEAQLAKKRHIAGKLLLKPGMRVLDIGCGWGGLALTLAREHGARVVGVTLSEEQLKLARERARKAGLEDRVQFHLMDYRQVEGPFDRIVSVGMFEHVGVPHYREYFAKVRDLLTEDGVALIHTIGRSSPPGATSPWIDKYIFPGGYVPALSEVMAAVEKEDLYADDIEVWRLHYAETLRHWHDRFVAREDEARALYDERFCRMWRYYLVAAELTFRLNRQVVFQIQLSKAQEAVPLTRDYLYPADREQRIGHAAE